MSLIETEETNRFSFEPFAAHSFYTTINRSLVRQALAHFADRPADKSLTIVDMACGTGAVTRLIAEEMLRQGRPAHIIGVDPSAEALRRAHKACWRQGQRRNLFRERPMTCRKLCATLMPPSSATPSTLSPISWPLSGR